MPTPNTKCRTLWLIFTIGLVASILGAAILLYPASEFFAVEILEKLKLPVGPIANVAFFADIALFAISAIGLMTMAIRALISRPAKATAP